MSPSSRTAAADDDDEDEDRADDVTPSEWSVGLAASASGEDSGGVPVVWRAHNDGQVVGSDALLGSPVIGATVDCERIREESKIPESKKLSAAVKGKLRVKNK